MKLYVPKAISLLILNTKLFSILKSFDVNLLICSHLTLKKYEIAPV